MLHTEPSAYYKGASLGLTLMLEARSGETGAQCPRVARLAEMLGRAVGLPRANLRDLKYGALLHDVGKVRVPDAILNKPGSLDDIEWKVMRMHPITSFQILTAAGFPYRVNLIALQHHERFDGTGYPDGLRGEQICREARIFSLADTYDAIVSDRCYRKGKPHDVAIKEIVGCAGTQFDPQIVDVFAGLEESQFWDTEAAPWQEH